MTRHTKRLQRHRKRPKRWAKVVRWENVSFTFNGQPMPRGTISMVHSVDAQPPAGTVDLTHSSYSASFEMSARLVEPGDLEALAWLAVVTPSVAAPEAFDVVVDALLERGLISPPPTPEEAAEAMLRALESGEIVSTVAAPKPLLVQAWDWVTEATALPLLERLLNEMRSVAPTIETATGETLDRLAEMNGLRRDLNADFGSVDLRTGMAVETDDQLRERCRALLDRMRPGGGPGALILREEDGFLDGQAVSVTTSSRTYPATAVVRRRA